MQGALALERSDSQFPTTFPPLKTAAQMLVLEAPRARRPAAWHEIMLIATTSRATISLQSHLFGFLCFCFPIVVLEKHLHSMPSLNSHKKKLKKHNPQGRATNNRSPICGLWRCTSVASLSRPDRKFKREKRLPATGKTNHIPPRAYRKFTAFLSENCARAMAAQ